MNTNKIRSISREMDALYGKAGTPEREQFRREAHAYCVEPKTDLVYSRTRELVLA